MGEQPKFERPNTPEEEHELVLARSEYLLKHIAEQEERHGIDPLTGARRIEVLKKELDHLLPLVRGDIKDKRKHKGVSADGISLVFIDLDKFKQVNDTHGHLVGDSVLKKVSSLLMESLRDEDMLARYGGDEFAILLTNTDEEDAVRTAEKLRLALDNDSELKKFGVTASIGVCASEASTASDSETFIRHADEVTYMAKREGGNRVEVYR